MKKSILAFLALTSLILSGCAAQLEEWAKIRRGVTAQAPFTASGLAFLRVSSGAQFAKSADGMVSAELVIGSQQQTMSSGDVTAIVSVQSVKTEGLQ